MPPLLDLNNDVLLIIYSQVSACDLARMARVSRRSKTVAVQDALWARHLETITGEYQAVPWAELLERFPVWPAIRREASKRISPQNPGFIDPRKLKAFHSGPKRVGYTMMQVYAAYWTKRIKGITYDSNNLDADEEQMEEYAEDARSARGFDDETSAEQFQITAFRCVETIRELALDSFRANGPFARIRFGDVTTATPEELVIQGVTAFSFRPPESYASPYQNGQGMQRAAVARMRACCLWLKAIEDKTGMNDVDTSEW